MASDASVISDRAKSGAILFFGKAKCAVCHSGPLFSDFEFHALAVKQTGPGVDLTGEDLGRYHATNDTKDRFKFRTPPLRNVTLTAPYFHDGIWICDPADNFDLICLDFKSLSPPLGFHQCAGATHRTTAGQALNLLCIIIETSRGYDLNRTVTGSVADRNERETGFGISAGSHPSLDGNGGAGRDGTGQRDFNTGNWHRIQLI